MININTQLDIKATKELKAKFHQKESDENFIEVLENTKLEDMSLDKKRLNKKEDVNGKKVQDAKGDKAEKKQVNESDLNGVLTLLSNIMNINSSEKIKGITPEDLKAIQSLMTDVKEILSGLKNGNTVEFKKLVLDLSENINSLMENKEFKKQLGIKGLAIFKSLLEEISNDMKTQNIIVNNGEKESIEKAITSLNNKIKDGKEKGDSKDTVKSIEENINKGDQAKNNNIGKKTANTSNDKSFKENKNNGGDNKPKDIQIKTEDDLKTKVKSEEKVLEKILNDDNFNMDKFSLFQKRVDITKNMEIKLETRVIDARNLRADLIKSVKFMATNSMKELTVKVYPKELGAITISLTQSEGTMKATLKPTSRETYSLLMQNSDEMKKLLGDQNIKVSSIDISLYNDDTTFYKESEFSNEFSNGQSGNNGKFNRDDTEKVISTEDEIIDKIINNGEVDMLA